VRRLRLLLPAFAVAAATALAVPAISSAASCRNTNVAPSAANVVAVRAATLCLLNHERALHHLPRLRAQRSLGNAARRYARLMVTEGFFGHVSPGGSTMTKRVKRTKYLRGARSWELGENLAWGAGAAATPAEIVDAWMHSPGHRRNILDPAFREIGVGIADGAPRQAGAASIAATFVTEFGRRSS